MSQSSTLPTRMRFATEWVAAGSGIVAIVVAIISSLTLSPQEHQISILEQRALAQHVEVAVANARLQAVEARVEVAELRAQLKALGKPSSNKLINGELQSMRSTVDDVSNRQKQIEQVILTTPEKALAIPILRKDIDAEKESATQSSLALRASIDQVYDLTKWLLGTMAISIVGLAFSTFFRIHQKGTDSTP